MNKALLAILGAFIVLGLLVAAFSGGFLAAQVFDPFPNRTTTEPIFSESDPVDSESPTPSDSEPPQATPASNELVDFQLIREVLALLKQDFYGDLPDARVLAYGAIRGMLSTLDDPYTSFIEPQIAEILNEDASGQFEGIGATVQMRQDGYLEIVRPLPGHPAEKAGLRSKDLILSVDDRSIVGMGLYEALGLIRGPAGTEITLEIARPEQTETFTVTLTRARIEVPVVEYRMEGEAGDIAYIQLTEFDANARSSVENAFKELSAQNPTPRGLILDLRDNPGGWLDQAIEVADFFLDEGLVARERDSNGHEEQFFSYDGDLAEDIPMVVLVNGGSASASEIVAGALQDRGRAILMGEQTLGKGSVQRPHELSDGSQLRVTIARWFTPNDKTIHGEGLTPDKEVPFPEDTPADQDPQLEQALEYLEKGN